MIMVAQSPMMSFLGNYNDLSSCQAAIREIYVVKFNAPGQRNPALDKAIQTQIDFQKEFLCVPVKKG
jgi:hypothetical protein